MQKYVWQPDAALEGFEAATIELAAGNEGPLRATLVRLRNRRRTGRAVLYIHGFIDYFFQAHMARRYEELGYTFYALDLHGYGRSLLPKQRPNACRDLAEYDAEIDAAIAIIDAEEDKPWLLLNGHSTGGLLSARYAHGGKQRERIGALFLNSPFFAFNLPPAQRPLLPVLARLGNYAPWIAIPGAISPLYAQSIHAEHRGRWQFNLEWKPIAGFPAYLGWMRAITLAQAQLQAGLQIACPILLLHSARSGWGTRWRDEFLGCDIVLDVAHMVRYAPRLGRDVRVVAIPDGVHDLMLSSDDVQDAVFREVERWAGAVMAGSRA
jgi:alpha-beta hydrolase superfamily lysophospholipase